MNKTNIIQDVWKSPEEACDMLGKEWVVNEGFIVKYNEYGNPVAKRRIFDGSEHPLAQAGMVVFREEELI